MRFIAFGCSITYGHGLSDCIADNRVGAGETPSKFSWPNHLASRYGAELINLAYCGGSNYYILNRILNFDWRDDDIALISFTYFYRYTIFDENEPPFNVNAQDVNNHAKKHRATAFYNLFDNNHLSWNDTVSIDSSFLFLNYKKIPALVRITDVESQQTYLNLTKINDATWIDMISKTPINEYQIDDALDVGRHPGPQSQKLIADNLVQDLDYIINMRK